MHLNQRLLTLLMTLLAAFFSAQAKAAQDKAVTSALNARLFYDILLGELSVQADDPGTGFALILDAARKTHDPALYRRAVQIALQTRSGKSALVAAKAWRDDAAEPAEANRYVLQIVLGMNLVQDAKEPLQRAVALASKDDQADTIWALGALFDHASDKRLAAQTVEQALQDSLQDPQLGPTAWAAIARLWLKASDPAAALDALEKGHRLDPKAERPAMVALALMEINPTAAETLVRSHLPHARPAFQMAFIKTLLNLQRSEEAQTALRSLLARQPDYSDAWLVQGLLSLGQRDWDQAEKQFQAYLHKLQANAAESDAQERRRGRAQAYFGLAQLEEERKNWAKADDWLRKVDDPDEALRATTKRAELLAQQEQLDPGLRLLEQYRPRSQAESRLKRSAIVQMLRDHGRPRQAIALLQQALAQDPGDAGAMYELAMVHEQSGQLAEMEHWLRKQIEIKPDDAQPYNALGYALADRAVRLDEAKKLIEKATSLSPDDPYIQDSLGWVEFRLGNFDRAIALLEQAFNRRPEAEIAAHLGEVLWSHQKRAQALEVFRQGWRLDPSNKTLRQTLARLNVTL